MSDPQVQTNLTQPAYPAPASVDPRRRLRYLAEAAGAYAAFAFFRMLPVDAASAIGGWIFQILGPLAKAHRIAERNVLAALPELTAAARKDLLRGMWNNIGRVAGEYAHLRRLASDPRRVEIVDPGNLCARAVSSGTGALALSAHFGNWELFCVAAFRAGGRQVDVYRATNNPYVDTLLKRTRLAIPGHRLIPKGHGGMREIVSQLRLGRCIGMVVDQKTNEGIPVEFFGRSAMTTRTPAALARRFECPIFVAVVERVGGARFRIVVHDMKVARSDNRRDDVERTTRAISDILEAAIRAKPELWMWVHRRWPD
ncbi:MAG: lauroyl acyltransferase [Alphaproteobacteria bacterium]|nr:lauroyl acyltransferase [Alphaproteobacteria bacterium]